MTTTTPAQTDTPTRWWRSGPNPPCVSWCTEEHEPGEFASVGGMLCRRSFLDLQVEGMALDGRIQVEVQRNQFNTADDPTPRWEDPLVWTDGITGDDDLTPEIAQVVGAALLAAAAFARAVQS